MMKIEYKIWTEGETLKAVAKGSDDDLEGLYEYIKAVIDKALIYKPKKIFCNETELNYKLTIEQIYNLSNYITKFSQYGIRIGILCNKKFKQDMDIYKSFSNNRGMIIEYMTTEEEAEKWLS